MTLLLTALIGWTASFLLVEMRERRVSIGRWGGRMRVLAATGRRAPDRRGRTA